MTSRTRKIAWWPHVFKLDFYVFSRIMSISGKFKEILSASFYCIIPPQGISSRKHNFFIKRFQTFSRLALMQSTQFFSCSLNLQDSCYWWKFFPYLQPVSWKVRNCLFPISLLNIETRFFNTIMQLQSKLCLKKLSQTSEDHSTEIVTVVYLLLQCKGTRPDGQNVAEFTFLIFATICYVAEWIWFV